MEWLGLEGTLQIIQFQTPPVGKDTFHQTRLLKAPSNLALDTGREGAVEGVSTFLVIWHKGQIQRFFATFI